MENGRCYNFIMVNLPDNVLRIIGEIRPHWADWSTGEYRGLFQRLERIAPEKQISRYLRYSGISSEGTELRIFGVDAGMQRVPKNMIAMEIGEDSYTVFKPGRDVTDIEWKGSVKWDWLDRTVPGAPTGEFSLEAPAEWTSLKEPAELHFTLTANAWFQRGREADDNVRLTEYDSRWPDEFDEAAEWLRKNVPPYVLLRVEHIGSTAIPGMPAKPVIDILIDVPSLSEARRIFIPLFNKPECEYWEYDNHLLFIKRRNFLEARTHHFHVALAGTFFGQRIAFRNYLRAHARDAARYASLKLGLAARYAADREEYTLAKGKFIEEINEKTLGLEEY